MRTRSLLATLLIVFAGPALAQSLGEKTGVNSALGITPHTSDFVKEAAQNDMFEIQSSQLASAKMQGGGQAFAKQMVTDHTKTTNELQGLAETANIPLPAAMSNSQEDMLNKLKTLNGDDFSKQYVRDQVSAHKTAASLFHRYSSGGRNAQIKAWAGQTVPTLQRHLDMANALNK